MYFQQRLFSIAKDASRPEENQDAAAADEARGIAAIADGVSSSLFSARWAQLLVSGVVAERPDLSDGQNFPAWLGDLRRQWRDGVDAKALAWHQKPKFADGAFATLLWIELRTAASGEGFTLRSSAVGDCCLFHVRDDRVQRAFPLESAELFGVESKAIGSSERQSVASLEFDTLEDLCREGDLLVLTTDALAAWALARLEAGESPGWESFWDSSPADFRATLDKLRAAQQIRYDDSTMLMLRVAAPLKRREAALDQVAEWASRVPRIGNWISDQISGR